VEERFVADIRIEDAAIPCPLGEDECLGMAEPDGDALVRYYVCGLCGYEFGFQQIAPADEGACSLGVAADVRRMLPAGPREPVMLQLGRRPE
jgi:hypothetical protein